MKSTLVITTIALAILLIACGKDKFETKPRLEIKDLSSREIRQGQTLRVRLNYFDKEGDLDEGSFIAIINRINKLSIAGTPADKIDTLRSNMPEFPSRDQGEITYSALDWNFLKESTLENDTIVLKFAVADRAGNHSDTITTDPIVIFMP